ncbi:MAG: serine protease [Treponema sp.]|jgi:serine protease Do|nr:serine protease [Treponema sp.]
MFRRVLLTTILTAGAAVCCFGQTSLLRDYVGLINQTFHPDIVAYMEKFKGDLERRGDADAAKSIDAYLKGSSGTGFVYVGKDGANYIITNHHVITQSYTLSVTFEKPDGARTKYEGLSILAADEDMDIALLAFPAGERPFTGGLAFLERAVEEGEDVYSAGFPGLGGTPIWQFGRGIVSNAQVRFPAGDDTDTIMGPYIQHTAQVDPGNSGGPLLVQSPEALSGYAVAGINTLSGVHRQAANFSIPMDRARSFLDAALDAAPAVGGEWMPADEGPRLDARVRSFIEGLKVPKAAYEHIAKYLSNACTAENAEFALSEMLRRAPRDVTDDIVRAFNYSPVEGMNYAVAWTIENFLRSGRGAIDIAIDTVVPGSNGGYTVSFTVSNGTVNSAWVREYGIWRISAFGDFAAGDKTFVEKREKARKEAERLVSEPNIQFAAGFAYVFDRGAAFGADLKFRTLFAGFGIRAYTRGPDFTQIEALAGIYVPVEVKNKIAFTPYGDAGLGFRIRKAEKEKDDPYDITPDFPAVDFGLSLQGGVMVTASAVPGLYLQAAYQYNLYAGDEIGGDPHMLFVGIGYGFMY